MDPLLINGEKPLQHVSTLVRQLVFDVVFVVENVVLITIALNSNVRELHENQVLNVLVQMLLQGSPDKMTPLGIGKSVIQTEFNINR